MAQADAPLQPGDRQRHHVAGDEFAATEKDADEADREHRRTEQFAQSRQFVRHGGDDAHVGEVADRDEGAAKETEDCQAVSAVFRFRRAFMGAVFEDFFGFEDAAGHV